MSVLHDYLEDTRTRTAEHVAQGHTADEAAADPAYPRFDDPTAVRYHEANIRFMYERLST